MFAHRIPWLTLLAGLGLVLLGPGCGECTFTREVTGRVVDADGEPVAGAEITSCESGNRCEADDDDLVCSSTKSGADGAFTLVVRMCRPAPGQCELRPLLITAKDCEPLVEQPAGLGEDAQDYALTCTSS